MQRTPRVRTCLWFDGQGEAAAKFYVSLLPNSLVESVSPVVVTFTLEGAPYMALNGGPRYKLTPAASIMVSTADQAETDRLWEALLADGGEESRCGWLVDRFGVSWQIVPEALPGLVGGPDRAAAGRATQAMMQMRKIDIAALQAAYDGA